jgi:hypothetical protein
VDECSRVLVFRDHNVDRAPSYILQVKVVAASFSHDLSMKDDPSAEIVLETDNANQTVSRTIFIHIAIIKLTHDCSRPCAACRDGIQGAPYGPRVPFRCRR